MGTTTPLSERVHQLVVENLATVEQPVMEEIAASYRAVLATLDQARTDVDAALNKVRQAIEMALAGPQQPARGGRVATSTAAPAGREVAISGKLYAAMVPLAEGHLRAVLRKATTVKRGAGVSHVVKVVNGEAEALRGLLSQVAAQDASLRGYIDRQVLPTLAV